MRVVCFGDSLALPREGCMYSDTWIAKLKSTFPNVDFICNFSGGMLVYDLERYWSYMRYAKADYAIIQEGICDCAPRYLNDETLFWKVVIKIIQKIRLTSMFWKIVKLGSRNPSCTLTTKNVFENKYNMLLEKMLRGGVKCVIIIKIGHGASSVIQKSVYFNSNVDEYNGIFDKLKEKYKERLILINPLSIVSEDMFVDGYHCNAKGMDVVYKELTAIISPLVN